MIYSDETYEEFCTHTMKLFFETGHSETAVPLYTSFNISDLVYLYINPSCVVTKADIQLLSSVRYSAHMFSINGNYFGNKDSGEPQIEYYLLCLDSSDRDRSYVAFDIHKAFIQIINTALTVILFSVNGNVMLSFGHRNEANDSSFVILSDWYSEDDFFNCLKNRIQAGTFSSKPLEFFLDFAAICARDYYLYPISYEYAAFEMIPNLFGDSGLELPERYIIREFVEYNIETPLRKYKEDYVHSIADNAKKSVWLSNEEFILDLLNLETLSQDEKDDFSEDLIGDEDYINGEDDIYNRRDPLFTSLPDGSFNDPKEMLRIINQSRKILDELTEQYLLEGFLEIADIISLIDVYNLPHSLVSYIVNQLQNHDIAIEW